jgi:2Fe-2S ferredoxin
MININFVSASSQTSNIKAKPGKSLMEAAIDANVKGIQADCGGLLTCGTCHVFVREPFLSQLPPIESDESGMLDFTGVPRTANSRLSCQINLTQAMDGITVDLPASQY